MATIIGYTKDQTDTLLDGKADTASLSSTYATPAQVERARVAPSLSPIAAYSQLDKVVLAQIGTTLYAKGTVGVPPTLYVSADSGCTWTARSVLPAKVDILYRVKATGTLIIIEGETVSTLPTTPSLPRVWRSTDDGATWTLIPGVLNVPPLGASGVSEGTGGEIMIAEYAALRPWVYRVRRSTDDGLTWATALSSDGRDPGAGDPGHMHSLTYDPVAGRHNVFMDYSVVEGVDGPQIWSSDDDGATWSLVGTSTSVDHPNFVTPMYFDNYIAWGSDNQINGRISRITRTDFYAGNFGAVEHVQQMSEKAIYNAMPIRASDGGGASVYLIAMNGEHINSALQDGNYSTMTEVYVVTNEGLTISGGVSTYKVGTAPGALTGVRASFPTFDFDVFDRDGIAWVNFPHGSPLASYVAIPLTQGWDPPMQQASPLTAVPHMRPNGRFIVQYTSNPTDNFALMDLAGSSGQVVIGNHSVAAGSRATIEVLPAGGIDLRSNGTLVAQLTGGRLLAYGRIDTTVAGCGIRGGIGSPEGAVAATIGSIYQTYNADVLYYKASGAPTVNTGWRRLLPPALPTTDLANIAHAVNTSMKYAGMQAFDTTAGRPVWAAGATAAALWVYADGTTAATPV